MSDTLKENPYQALDASSEPAKSKVWRWLATVGIGAAIMFVLVCLLLPAQRSAPGAGKRMNCQKNIREIGLSAHNYQASAGPEELSDQTVDSARRSVHGWRTLVSFTAESDFYRYAQMRLAKPRPSPEF